MSITISSIVSPAVITPPSENLDFDVLQYPAEAVKSLEKWGVTEEELKSRADSKLELYVGNQGYDDINGVVISPYYTAKISDKDIPVYAATVFLGETQYGELHSKDFRIKNAICLPENLGVKAKCSGGVMTEASMISAFTPSSSIPHRRNVPTLFL